MIQQDYKNSVEDVSGEVVTTGFSIEINESMFQMLTSNVYSDPTLAVVREWSTNACDACIDAGTEVKFDVHLPTLEEPNFSVRDYGTGLAPEDIVGLFSNLGASTKRNSNAYNGTLGIGRMAGLAVSNAFTVESFYKGTKYAYAISMQNGIPVTLHMGSTPTVEHNGLKLSVAVDINDIGDYVKKAKYLYRYFDHKPTLNRDDVDVHLSVEEHISDDWFIQKPENAYSYTNYVVMSQVPYAIPDNHVVETHGFRNLVIKAPAGSVSFNPGRESLSLNKDTVDYLNTTFTKIADDYISAATIAMVNTTNDYELMKVYRSLSSNAPNKVAEKINPTKFASQSYQNIFSMHRYRTSTPGFQYVSDSTDFRADTASTLCMAYKSNYYKTSKPIVEDNPLSWSKFFYASHVVVDVKTNFRSALNEHFSGKSLVTWQRVGKEELTDAVEHAKRYLDELGIPYQMASDLVTAADIKVSAPRSGLYVSSLARGRVLKAEKMSKEEAESGKYLYLKLIHSTPDIPEGSKHSIDDYLRAYSLLTSTRSTPPPPIRGVAKKYQPYVEDLDNWITLQDYLEDTMAQSTFKAPSEDVPLISFPQRFISDINVDEFPDDVQECYKEWLSYRSYSRAKDYLGDSEVLAMAKSFGATLDSYEWPEDIDITYLNIKYSRSFPILSGNVYFPHMEADFLPYMMKLEDYYATHSSK